MRLIGTDKYFGVKEGQLDKHGIGGPKWLVINPCL